MIKYFLLTSFIFTLSISFVFSNENVTLPSNLLLPSSAQPSTMSDDNWASQKKTIDSEKSTVFQDLADKLDKLIEDNPDLLNKIENGINGLNNGLDGLNKQMNQEISSWIEQEKSKATQSIEKQLRRRVDDWLDTAKSKLDQATDDIPAVFKGPNVYTAEELPSFENYEIHTQASFTDDNGGVLTLNNDHVKESIDIESSQERKTFKNTSLSYETENGFKVMVYQQEKGFYLRHLLTADTKIKGNFQVNAQAAANMVKDANAALGSNPYAGISDANIDMGLQASGELNANINTQAEIDVNIITKEEGVVFALPVAETKQGSRLVLETGIKRRVDFVVVSLRSMKVSANGSVSGQGSLDANATLSGQINPANGYNVSLPNQNLHKNVSESGTFNESVSGNVDVKQELQDRNVKTSYGSKSEYYVVPVGIGFYSSNGSKIRLLVDLKPERINQPLELDAPKDIAQANQILSMISGAQLEAEGRADFQAFTILAGLNASFKTIEVKLDDVGLKSQGLALPSEVKAELYFGIETDSFRLKASALAELELNKGKGAAYIEASKRFSNGFTLGVMAGYEKHVHAYGAPEMNMSDMVVGSKSFNQAFAQGNATGNANFGLEHDTVVNEGQNGYRVYDAIPVSVMMSAPAGKGELFAGGGVTLTNQNSNSFAVADAFGTAGYRQENWTVSGGATRTFNDGTSQTPYNSFVLGAGVSF
ncbi:MAG: hypothetical protein KC646_03895 [Candidatus Cloacimonetes bacterium]|nr:hypothetical protein [Candidatus Cloacimonadota bacterium]